MIIARKPERLCASENQRKFFKISIRILSPKKLEKKMEIETKKGTKQNCLVPVSPKARMNQESLENQEKFLGLNEFSLKGGTRSCI